MRAVFADTGYWVAISNPRDALHLQAKDLSRSLRPVHLVTSETVLTEYLNDFSQRGQFLRRAAVALIERLRSDPNTTIVRQTSTHFWSAFDLYAARTDKAWSHTDCASFRIMERHRLSEALAYDKHFEQAGFKALLRRAYRGVLVPSSPQGVSRGMTLDTWCCSDVGLVRSSNQDAFECLPEGRLFMVADGMGGHADGDVASRIAVETIRDVLAADPGKLGSESDSLKRAVLAADARIRASSGGRVGTAAMGTTVVVLKLSADMRQAHWAHVGDSRLYRLRGALLELLTADHTEFGEAYRRTRPIPLDLPHTNQLLEVLGVGPPPKVGHGADAVQPGDLFLLCSDGLSGCVPPRSLQSELGLSRSLEATGTALLALSCAAGAPDNVTIVLLRIPT
jgi:serine/threonine protein phosphatase PrpC/predicted nucleic acid-binding protein